MSEVSLRYHERAAPFGLARHVKCVWRLQGPASEHTVPEPVIPDGCVEIVLNLGDPFLRHRGPGQRQAQPLLLVAGQLTEAITIEPSGRVDLLGVRFHPWSAAAFLGVSARELQDEVLGLDEVRPELAGPLGVLSGAPPERCEALLEKLLIRRGSAVRPLVPGLARLAAHVAEHRPAMSVNGIARWAGLSTRRVQGLFAEHVGMSPKQLMRIRRFQRALGLARSEPALSWSSIAVRAGYYDQAHLVHESRALAGCPPSALVMRGAGLTEAFLEHPSGAAA